MTEQERGQERELDLDAICQDLQEKVYTQAMRIAELEEALAKQEQGKPVAVVIEESTFDGYRRKGIAWNFRLDSFDIGTKFYTTSQQRKPLTDEWFPVTQALLYEQHDWLYKPMWIAMPNGRVCTGYYEWRQGRCPDRFITDDLGDMDAFSASHIMPMVKPTAPAIEAAHGIKEKNT